jgi:hypothetical protein
MSARTITPAPLSAPTSTPKPAAAARTKLLLEGPIPPTLLRLAAPNVLNLIAFVGVIAFGGFFLGRIGTNALAGASLAFSFVMLVLQTTNSGMGAGVTSAIARAPGAGKRYRADELVFHAIVAARAMRAAGEPGPVGSSFTSPSTIIPGSQPLQSFQMRRKRARSPSCAPPLPTTKASASPSIAS